MNELDAMTLLAEANPVLVEDLAQLDRPDTTHRPAPRRRFVLAVAIMVVAVIASVIGAFVFNGPNSHPVRPGGRLGAVGATGTDSAQPIALSDASSALRAPVVLPDTELVHPSDAAADARATNCPYDTSHRTPGYPLASPCVVEVKFPAQAIDIEYHRPTSYDTDPTLATYKAGLGNVKPPAKEEVLDLKGVPGIWVEYPGIKSVVEFVLGGTRIDVVTSSAKYDEATLRAIAQSIVDRSK